jgi:hypothetical protein
MTTESLTEIQIKYDLIVTIILNAKTDEPAIALIYLRQLTF